MKETLTDEAPEPTETAAVAPARIEVSPVPLPATQESLSDDENGNDENVPSVDGSSDQANFNESPSPSTFSPTEVRRGPRILDPGKTASSAFVP